MLLFLASLALFYYGRKIVRQQIHQDNHGNWPTRLVLRGIRDWEQERVMTLLGGAALQFSAIVIIVSLIMQQ